MTYLQEAIAETYADVRLLIFDTVHKFRRDYGGDFEELVGDAHQIFMEAYYSYDPDYETKFSMWLRFKIWKGLLEKTRTYAKHEKMLPRRDCDPTQMPVREQPTFSLLDFVTEKELSQDAITVVQIVLNPPPGLGKIFEKSGWKKVRGCLREYLRGLGWTVARISESFSEIRQVL